MDKTIRIVKEDGTEVVMTILFTYTDKEKNRNYVLYYDDKSEDGTLYAFRYDDQENLYELENESEWKMAQKVYDMYLASEDEEGIDDEDEDVEEEDVEE